MSTSSKPSFLHNIHPVYKLLIALAIGIISYFSFFKSIDVLGRLMIAWDAFTLVTLVIYWYIFFITTTKQIRAKAKDEDTGVVATFSISLIAALASLFAVTLLLTSDDESNKVIHIISAVLGLMFSWLMVHTLFAARYAHLFYADDENDESKYIGGLEFPDNEEEPDFIDFAYFSFTIGMTFQVSDVEISDKKLRRLALIHSLISFGFNTIIVALTINVVAGLGEK